VRNAARYTQEGTCAEISLEREQGSDGPEAVIRIVDSGPGVPEEALDKLFRPFYRIDDARGRQTGGAGLGLAITERAVRLHGGTVKASNRPTGGLQIEVRLPIDRTEEARVVTGDLAGESRTETSKVAGESPATPQVR
jgi:two-component system sensor histidine kinase CpxA